MLDLLSFSSSFRNSLLGYGMGLPPNALQEIQGLEEEHWKERTQEDEKTLTYLQVFVKFRSHIKFLLEFVSALFTVWIPDLCLAYLPMQIN